MKVKIGRLSGLTNFIGSLGTIQEKIKRRFFEGRRNRGALVGVRREEIFWKARSGKDVFRWGVMGVTGVAGVLLLAIVANTAAGVPRVEAVTSTYEEVKMDPWVLDRMADLNISYYSPCTLTSGNGGNTNQNCGTPSGSDVIWIGDSYSTGNNGAANEEITKALSGVTVYSQGCKTIATTVPTGSGGCGERTSTVDEFGSDNVAGTEIARKLASSGKLKDKYLVFALGTNNPGGGSTQNSAIEELKKMISGELKDVKGIVLVNASAPSDDYSSVNNGYKEIASSNSNVIIADWAAVAKDEYYKSDPERTHPFDGYDVWVKAVTDALGQFGGACTGGNCDFTKYNYDDVTLTRIASVAMSENGADNGRFEMSLMANLFEAKGSGRSDVLDYVLHSGWFSNAESHSHNSVSNEVLTAAKDIFNNGKRVIPKEITEHDCIDCGSYGFDVSSIELDGKTYTNHSDLLNLANYVSGKTVIHNKYGSTYTFYSWPDGQKSKTGTWQTDYWGDPFGSETGSWGCDPQGGGSSDSGNTTSKSNKKTDTVAKDKKTVIGPSGDTVTDGGGMGDDERLEYIWNAADKWMTGHNINLGGGERAAILAAFLGNTMGESGGDPFADGSCVGLFQDCEAEDIAEVKSKVNAATGGNYWGRTDAPANAIKKAIDIEIDLEFSADGGSDFFNSLDKPSAKTGVEGAKAYAELFLVTVERAVANDSCVGNTGSINPSPITDPGVVAYQAEIYKGTPNCVGTMYQGTDLRKQHAEEYYNKFKGLTGGESTSSGAATCCGSGGSSSTVMPTAASGTVAAIQSRIKDWAWESSGHFAADQKPAYTEAWKRVVPEDQWANTNYGNDCTTFVGVLVKDSGLDPDYPDHWTVAQSQYLATSDKWVDITDSVTAETLQPGDVFMDPTSHTLIYGGKIEGFESEFYEASFLPYNWAPQSGWTRSFEDTKSHAYKIYRRKDIDNGDKTSTVTTTKTVNTAGGTVADLQAAVQKYAWGKNDSENETQARKTEYANLWDEHQEWHMNTATPGQPATRGNDCAAWVRAILWASGWDKKTMPWGMLTGDMSYYAENGWEDVTSSVGDDESKLQPGDVLANPGHVKIYVGKIDGFTDSGIVSANGLKGTAPSADVSWDTQADGYQVFRQSGHVMGTTVTEDPCGGSLTTSSETSSSSGLKADEGKKIVDDYNANYSGSAAASVAPGPANCFALSVWWLMKYTSLDYHVYAEKGHAAEFVRNLATKQGVPYGSTPQVYSIFSTNNPQHSSARDGNGELYGHTGIVVAINGDTMTILEAGAGFGGGVVTREAKISEFTNSEYPGYEFAYINNYMKTDELNKIIGR